MLVGDNLAVSSNATIAMFLLAESPGHRAALLNRYADAVAIGASRSERREGNTVRQGIYFCMAFVQANDVAVHAQLEEAREHHRAEQEPGGEHLTRARMQRDNGKIYQALKSYEEYLQEQQDSPHRELVERWVTRLTADLERQQVDPDRKSWVVWNGKLQSAANLLRNRRPDKARLRLEELLRACPLEDIRAEARTLLDSIGDE